VTDTFQPTADALRARIAVGWIFAINGFGIATWLARLPAIRDTLGLAPSRLALVLISGSFGAVLALPISGAVVHRLGPARTVRAAGLLCMTGVSLVGLAGGGVVGGVPLMMVGLVGFGIGNAMWDVGMNVEGAEVERRIRRAIMPRFHAAFSLGTVAGAGLGAAAAALHVPVAVHVIAVAVVVATAVVGFVRRFLPVVEPEPQRAGAEPGTGKGSTGSGSLAAWLEPRTILIGLMVLGMAMAEGSANDWLAIGLVDGYDVDYAVGALGFGVFVTAMTTARMLGPQLLARFGRVPALRASALLVLVGVLAFVGGARLIDTAGSALALVVAGIGAFAWGCGSALGFPVGMSAAADNPSRSAARVSVVASLGYVAFLAGPPFLGFLGDRVGVVNALLGVGVAMAISLLCAGAARATTPAA
jgi:MFS family permease